MPIASLKKKPGLVGLRIAGEGDLYTDLIVFPAVANQVSVYRWGLGISTKEAS